MNLCNTCDDARCVNCAHLRYTGVPEIFRCSDPEANRHPMYRTMTVGEAMTYGCRNRWQYRAPSRIALKFAPNAIKFMRAEE